MAGRRQRDIKGNAKKEKALQRAMMMTAQMAEGGDQPLQWQKQGPEPGRAWTTRTTQIVTRMMDKSSKDTDQLGAANKACGGKDKELVVADAACGAKGIWGRASAGDQIATTPETVYHRSDSFIPVDKSFSPMQSRRSVRRSSHFQLQRRARLPARKGTSARSSNNEQDLRPTKGKSNNSNSFCDHPSDSDCDFDSYYSREFIFDKVEAAMCMVKPPFRTNQQWLSECLAHDVVLKFTFDARGTWILQQAFELLVFETRYRVVNELRGYVAKAVDCPHGNHVVQKAIVTLPPARTQFIRQEVTQHWSAVDLALHTFGCRVLMRMIECYPYALWSELCESIIGALEGHSRVGPRDGNRPWGRRSCVSGCMLLFDPCYHAVLKHIIEFCPKDGPKARIAIVVTRTACSRNKEEEWALHGLSDLLCALLKYSVLSKSIHDEDMDEDTMTVATTNHPKWTHTAVKQAILDWMGDPDSRRMGLPKSVWDGWSIVLGGHMANSQPILTKTEIFIMLSERSGLPRILQSEAC